MALYDYNRAEKLGRKQYQASLMKGEHPYLPVLDDILSYTDIVSEVNLGLVDIPLNRIVGTMTQGRTNAFASNFMPLLPEKTEFAAKWSILYDHQLKEGIHDPIIAYEFMNKYYVQEGNKRVSVLKYLNAFSIPGIVTRLLPRRSDDKENKESFADLNFDELTKKQKQNMIKTLTAQMQEAAKKLDFEEAANLRDAIMDLKKQVYEKKK